MLTCLAMALSIVSLGDIPSLASQVEADARTLTAEAQIDADFLAQLTHFSEESMQLSDSLRAAGVTQDLPCIFRGISQDALERSTDIQNATDDAARADALAGLRALLDDAILLAPMAAGAAADAQGAQAAAAEPH